MTPARLQLSRRKGFNLQELSYATNRLPAINVARPSRWGNHWKVGELLDWWIPDDGKGPLIAMNRRVMITPEIAVHQFRVWLHGERPAMLVELKHDLGGRNLACWCKPGAPCHADLLLDLANR